MKILTRAPLLALVLAGCATVAEFQTGMDAFIGRTVDEAQDAFGYPQQVRDLPDGGKAYTWLRVETGYIPGYRGPTTVQSVQVGDTTQLTVIPGTYIPPQIYRDSCEFTLTADAQNRVRAWRAQGDGCRGTPVRPVLRSGSPAR